MFSFRKSKLCFYSEKWTIPLKLITWEYALFWELSLSHTAKQPSTVQAQANHCWKLLSSHSSLPLAFKIIFKDVWCSSFKVLIPINKRNYLFWLQVMLLNLLKELLTLHSQAVDLSPWWSCSSSYSCLSLLPHLEERMMPISDNGDVDLNIPSLLLYFQKSEPTLDKYIFIRVYRIHLLTSESLENYFNFSLEFFPKFLQFFYPGVNDWSDLFYAHYWNSNVRFRAEAHHFTGSLGCCTPDIRIQGD